MKENRIQIKEVFISFGWPDLILLIKSNNVELIKSSIIELRDLVAKSHDDNIETSTIICTTIDDLDVIKGKKVRK